VRLVDTVPDFLKPILRPIYYATYWKYKKMICHPRSCSELHQYWRQPCDGYNLPEHFLKQKERSLFLVKKVKEYVPLNAKILEIGCNIGRNLSFLFRAGFENLAGVEISEKAVKLLKQYHPKMAYHAKIYNMPIEEKIRAFRDCEFDIVFTMAVLEHIHTDSKWIFSEMARITKGFLITIEDEHNVSWRHFTRNYKKVFESIGMKQIEEINCREVCKLCNYVARVFKRESFFYM